MLLLGLAMRYKKTVRRDRDITHRGVRSKLARSLHCTSLLSDYALTRLLKVFTKLLPFAINLTLCS